LLRLGKRFNEANFNHFRRKTREKKQKLSKIASLKFNAEFTQGANPQPSNLQSRAD